MLESSDKYFKATTMKMLQQSIPNSPETNEKVEKPQRRNTTYKKKQMEMIELKI